MARKPRKLPPSQRPGHISCYLTMQQFKSAELTGNPRAIIGQLQRLASSLAQNGQIDVKTLLVWADGRGRLLTAQQGSKDAVAQSLRAVVAQQRPDAVATLMEGWSNTTNPGPDATTLEGLPGTVDVVMIIYEDATGTTECYTQ